MHFNEIPSDQFQTDVEQAIQKQQSLAKHIQKGNSSAG